MTIFSEEPHSRQMERLMTAIPNFKPRGVGFRFSETQITDNYSCNARNTDGCYAADTLSAVFKKI